MKKKKITFLLLHLGYGGIESSTINSANALINEYDVEIVSFYNLKKNQRQDLDKRIIVKYIYNGEPNRKEFKLAVSKKNIINILKEGFKAVSILLKRKYLIIKEIKNNTSDCIVSTTFRFSPLLSKYGKKETLKIAQEHHHHNNNRKYINILKRKYKRIDVLCALTNSLKKDYMEFLKDNNHTKIVLLPNMLVKYPQKYSRLENNYISVGRLSKGKRINELVEIFRNIKNKESKLFIIGEGEESVYIKDMIKKLQLEDRVIMLGYLSHKDQIEYLLKSRAFLMTSETEGLPMVLLEAMSYGIPCIAYQTDSGVSDIIDDSINGYIIKNRNPKKYIEMIDKLSELKDSTIKKLSKEAIKKSKKFSEQEILKIWRKIIDQKSIIH